MRAESEDFAGAHERVADLGRHVVLRISRGRFRPGMRNSAGRDCPCQYEK